MDMIVESNSDIYNTLKNNSSSINEIEETLTKFRKYSTISNLKKLINSYATSENINFVNQNKLNIKIEKNERPKKIYYCPSDEEENEIHLSLNRAYPDVNIDWKTSTEIFGKNTVILPNKIEASNFIQGKFGDCYLISSISSLSQIPQLLNFIMRLSCKRWDNDHKYIFTVNFFIDGEWKIIYIKDSFPVYDNNKLIGAKPSDDRNNKKKELFMMILEKAWAQINGGYDQISGGFIHDIFELFLGASCDKYEQDNKKDLFTAIKENEKQFGTLSLCGAKYYQLEKGEEIKDKINFDKNSLLNQESLKIIGNHAYKILKTLEIIYENKSDLIQPIKTCKVLIISNPHGKYSRLIDSGIELKKIEKVFEEELKDIKKYKYYIEKNKIYEITGIIYMPLTYFITWQNHTEVCYPHFGVKSYKTSIENENLYIYKIKLNEKQLITCQLCFQSIRAHRDKIDIIKIIIENIENNHKKELMKIRLFYHYCGIKIIKNDQNLTEISTKNFENESQDSSSIKELNKILYPGEYYIMIYAESSLNNYCVRFLSEKEIEINLIKKIEINDEILINNNYNNYEYNQNLIENNNNYNIFRPNSLDYISNINYNYINDNPIKNRLKKIFDSYKYYLSNFEDNTSSITFKKEDFLPGIKEYYLYFQRIAQSIGLAPEDAIYTITKEGESSYFCEIKDVNTMQKIYGKGIGSNGTIKSNCTIDIGTLQFRDIFGYPYKVNNLKEAINEIKVNREPLNCLFSQYDENTKHLVAESTYLKVYYNRATNDDILVITNKKGDYKYRYHSPLFIIFLDVSGSMSSYTKFIQNELIPGVLYKLGYIWEDNKFFDLLRSKNITNFEFLQAISSKIKLKNFLEKYDLKELISEINLKYFCNDIIPLITFSDDSKLYFTDYGQFKKCNISEGGTLFYEAAQYFKSLLQAISKERSIRVLTFSDGEIGDEAICLSYLEEILNSPTAKHHMNCVSVRVRSEYKKDILGNEINNFESQPNTRLLMKLSKFSKPINDMNLIDIFPNCETIEEATEKIVKKFRFDGTKVNLILFSDIIGLSNEFSNNFSNEQFFGANNKTIALRTNCHNSLTKYKNSLEISSGKLEIIDGGEVKESNFYNILKDTAPLIGQRIVERKVNKNINNINVNQEIINYFKITETSFDIEEKNKQSFKSKL